LRLAVTLEPKLRHAYFLLGRTYQRQGRKAEADEAFKTVDRLSREQNDAVRAKGKPR
jgi:Flp pilus assembly protein TadD